MYCHLLWDIPEAVVHASSVGGAEVISAAGGPQRGLGGESCRGHETSPRARTLLGAGGGIVVQTEVVAQLVGESGRHLVQVIAVPHIYTS